MQERHTMGKGPTPAPPRDIRGDCSVMGARLRY
ncbi:hypothetical protein C8E08_4178 [Paracidovorax citrulli]|nr:hypothetical protein C8E08_4178 [Paracidovorax citrulli]